MKSYSGKELITQLRSLEPYEFEKFVADIWREMGYDAEVTKQSRDRGIDVVAVKSGVISQKYLIQVKRYGKANNVGVNEVRQCISLQQTERDADGVIIVSTSGFTKPAKELGENSNIKLVDSGSLRKLISEHAAEVTFEKYVDFEKVSDGSESNSTRSNSRVPCPIHNHNIGTHKGQLHCSQSDFYIKVCGKYSDGALSSGKYAHRYDEIPWFAHGEDWKKIEVANSERVMAEMLGTECPNCDEDYLSWQSGGPDDDPEWMKEDRYADCKNCSCRVEFSEGIQLHEIVNNTEISSYRDLQWYVESEAGIKVASVNLLAERLGDKCPNCEENALRWEEGGMQAECTQCSTGVEINQEYLLMDSQIDTYRDLDWYLNLKTGGSSEPDNNPPRTDPSDQAHSQLGGESFGSFPFLHYEGNEWEVPCPYCMSEVRNDLDSFLQHWQSTNDCNGPTGEKPKEAGNISEERWNHICNICN